MTRHLLCLTLLLPAFPAWGEETLGRLFFSPEQRLQLELQRNHSLAGNALTTGSTGLALEGLVRRSGARGKLWINGQGIDTPPSSPASAPEYFAIENPLGQHQLRVGDRLLSEQNTVAPLLPASAIRIRKP